MTPQEREEIEAEIQYLQMRIDGMPPLFDSTLEKMGVESLLKFARQQLTHPPPEIQSICHKLRKFHGSQKMANVPHEDILKLVDAVERSHPVRVDGQKLMERIIDSCLFIPQCAESDSHGIVTVWSSGAAEQLEALSLECLTMEEKE